MDRASSREQGSNSMHLQNGPQVGRNSGAKEDKAMRVPCKEHLGKTMAHTSPQSTRPPTLRRKGKYYLPFLLGGYFEVTYVPWSSLNALCMEELVG